MHFCTECGTPLPYNNTTCHQCGNKTAALENKPPTPAPDKQSSSIKTAHIHGISGCTNYLLKGTRPIRGKKMATPGLDSIPAQPIQGMSQRKN